MAPEKRQITRNRTSYSCQTCRRRKVKCDKKHPICGTCEKNNEECIYATDNDEAQPKTDNTPETNRKRKLAPEAVQTVPSDIDAAVPTDVEDKLMKIQSLLGEATALANEAGLASDDQAPNDTSIAANTTESLQSISERLESLNLLFKSGKSSVKTPPTNEAAYTSQRSQPTNSSTARPFLNLPQQTPWENDLSVKALPDGQSNVLFRCWLVSTYSILPIVDPYEAFEKYKTFHSWYRREYDKGVPNPVEEWMPLIIAIQHGGLLGLSARGARKWWPEVPRRVLLCNIRLHFWRVIDTVKPSISTVAAEVMMRHTCHERYTVTRSSAQLAILIRNAQGLGLHRNASRLTATASYQIRRRLWWEIVNLDTLLASSCLIPPLLNDEFFNNKLPSELKDKLQGTKEAFKYDMSLQARGIQRPATDFPFDEERQSIISPYGLVSAARAMWTVAMRKLVAIITGVETITQVHIAEMSQVIADINVEIKAIIDRISTNNKPELSDPPPANTNGQSVAVDAGSVFGKPISKDELDYQLGSKMEFDDSQMPFLHMIEVGANSFYKWARIALSMLLDQIICFAFAPFLKDPNSKLWPLVRKCTLRSCQRFFRRYISLATTVELESFRWTWVGMFQPIHASKILLIDLHERPFSDEAINSRALFDQMLLLNYPIYGILGGSHGLTFIQSLEDETQESWPLLNHLRFKAWQRADLDPVFLWNEQDQLQRIQQRNDQGLEGLQRLTGKVRSDQPLAPQTLIDESEWRLMPTKYAAPFEGLNELIFKIRGSKTTAPPSAQEVGSEHQTPVGSNFYGDQILNQNKRVRAEPPTTDIEVSQAGSSSLHSSALQPGYAVSTAMKDGREKVSRSTSPYFNLRPATVRVQPLQYTTANDDGQIAPGFVSMPLSSGERGILSETDLHAFPEFGHIYPHSQIPLPSDQSIQHNHEMEFDWERWESVYAYPSGTNVQGLASADTDVIVQALSEP